MPPHHKWDPIGETGNTNNNNEDEEDWINVDHTATTTVVVGGGDDTDDDDDAELVSIDSGYLMITPAANAVDVGNGVGAVNHEASSTTAVQEAIVTAAQDAIPPPPPKTTTVKSTTTTNTIAKKSVTQPKEGRKKLRRRMNDMQLGVDVDSSRPWDMGQLELDIYPNFCPFESIVEEYQGFPRTPSPDLIRTLFLKCREKEYFKAMGLGGDGETEKPRRGRHHQKQKITEDTCRNRVPKHLLAHVMRQNSERQVGAFGSMENMIRSHFNCEGKVNFFDGMCSMVNVQPARTTSSKLVIAASSDWSRVCVHVICAWHGFKSATIKGKQGKTAQGQLMTIEKGRSVSKGVFPMSDYLRRRLESV